MHNVEIPNVSLAMHNNTRPAHITAARDHSNIPRLKGDEIRNLIRLQVELDRVVHLDSGVGVSDRTTVVRRDVGNTARAERHASDFEQLVGGFFGCDAVDCETALDVVQDAEVLAGFFQGDDVYEK